MKMKLEMTKEKTNCKLELYALGKYKVEVTYYDDGSRYVRVRRAVNERYLPDIFGIDNFEGDVIRFDIQTTSYGAISADEIRKVIEGYNEAVKVAEFLTKEFVKM